MSGATVDTKVAAEWLGCHPKVLERLARQGRAPVTPIRVGARWRWPTAPLLRLLDGDQGDAERR